MKNNIDFEIIKKSDIDYFLYNLWATPTFKNLHKNNMFFKLMIQKASELPLFFYEAKTQKQRNHLTSFFRLISYRQYENKYIQDLYYFHELCHLINYEAKENIEYVDWSKILNENELYASIMSEVVIYFFDKDLHKKTFNPLWANFFIHNIFDNSKFVQSNYGIYYDSKNSDDLKILEKENSLFNLDENNWPQNIKDIIQRRRQLRLKNLDDIEALHESEKTIVIYNVKREPWIQQWEHSYKTINKMLINFQNDECTDSFLDTIHLNTDKNLIVFPLKKSVNISAN